jgi:hypothetical protein
MTWKNRGIPYGRSTGNWVRIDTVILKPVSLDVGGNDAVAIIDNETYGSGIGTGIGIYSHTFITLATVEDGTINEVAGLQILQAAADGSCDISLLSGRLTSDNGNIIISSCTGSGVKGNIELRGGTPGDADAAGALTIVFDDIGHLGGILDATFGQTADIRSGGILTLMGGKDGFAPVISIGDALGQIFISGENVQCLGNDTQPSEFDGYAGGLTLHATGGILVIEDLVTTAAPIAPPAMFSGTKTIDGVEVPYY